MSATPGGDFPQGMPSPDTLQTTLRRLTETLAIEVARPSATAPDWSDSEWLLARAVAAIHGISPLLSRSLRWRGPSGWQDFLDDQRIHTLNRHTRIRDLLINLDEAGRRDDIPLVALKGAALHELQLYSPGERPMADVDLLVREQDVRRSGQMLESLGFRAKHTNWKHQVFATDDEIGAMAFGENVTNGMKVELHSRLHELLPLRAAEVTTLIFPREPHAGLNDYPSRAALMTHLLLHAAGGDGLPGTSHD